MLKLDPTSKLPLSDRVADVVREAILIGELRPGLRLTEEALADQLGVSRGSVREAIRHLTKEGLLVSRPYRGTEVAEITRQDVVKILVPLRLLLETTAIEFVINQGRLAEMLDSLSAIVSKMESEGPSERRRLVVYDLAFHGRLIDAARSQILKNIWQASVNQIRLHFSRNIKYLPAEQIVRDHRYLVETFRSADREAIGQALRHHMLNEDSLRCFDNAEPEGG